MVRLTDGCKMFRRWVATDPSERTDQWIAEQVGVSRPAVIGWRNGTTRPEGDHVLALQKLTGIAPMLWRHQFEREALAARLAKIRPLTLRTKSVA